MNSFQPKRRLSDSIWKGRTGPLGSVEPLHGRPKRMLYSVLRLVVLLVVLFEILRLGGISRWPWQSRSQQGTFDKVHASIPMTPIEPTYPPPAPVVPLHEHPSQTFEDDDTDEQTYKRPAEPAEVPPPVGPDTYGDPVWANFGFLVRYFGGLRALTTRSSAAEYPPWGSQPSNGNHCYAVCGATGV
ncbi:hypothetical protein N7468_000962 [Penicillium chermesinum]|uniref:Transmembrane protein n=1 Tax=Penicillium chermesinum TaxID=63820 RepID=A0A9W9TY63_9EURO|nr:uncharacterized protein N7468_000962 [Penicillium chermesinum]KAJ5245979.1 hypothetical protein N7468_000962 [Penicillium chermesinum]